MNNGSNWDTYRKNKAIADAGGNYRAWDGGKGDIPRGDQSKFRLGLELIEVAEKFGNESTEYKAALKAWKEAQ